jgi:hypothetical protein
MKIEIRNKALALDAVCSGWFLRAKAIGLPKSGVKRASDQEAYMQGALAMLVGLDSSYIEEANRIGFLTAVGRLDAFIAAGARGYEVRKAEIDNAAASPVELITL